MWKEGKIKVITEEQPKFKEVVVGVMILGPEYFGAKTLVIEPKRKVTSVNMDIELRKTKKVGSISHCV